MLLAACIALAFRAHSHASDLELAGWGLLAARVAVATGFEFNDYGAVVAARA